MECKCGEELKTDKDSVYCPKCGWSFTIELIKELFEFIKGKV